jgi:hypothetical protein
VEENARWNARLSGEGGLVFGLQPGMRVSEEVGVETECESGSCSHAKGNCGEVETSSSVPLAIESLWTLNDDAVETVRRSDDEVGPVSTT